MNVRHSQAKTVRKKAIFIKVHNFTYLEFDNIFQF